MPVFYDIVTYSTYPTSAHYLLKCRMCHFTTAQHSDMSKHKRSYHGDSWNKRSLKLKYEDWYLPLERRVVSKKARHTVKCESTDGNWTSSDLPLTATPTPSHLQASHNPIFDLASPPLWESTPMPSDRDIMVKGSSKTSRRHYLDHERRRLLECPSPSSEQSLSSPTLSPQNTLRFDSTYPPSSEPTSSLISSDRGVAARNSLKRASRRASPYQRSKSISENVSSASDNSRRPESILLEKIFLELISPLSPVSSDEDVTASPFQECKPFLKNPTTSDQLLPSPASSWNDVFQFASPSYTSFTDPTISLMRGSQEVMDSKPSFETSSPPYNYDHSSSAETVTFPGSWLQDDSCSTPSLESSRTHSSMSSGSLSNYEFTAPDLQGCHQSSLLPSSMTPGADQPFNMDFPTNWELSPDPEYNDYTQFAQHSGGSQRVDVVYIDGQPVSGREYPSSDFTCSSDEMGQLNETDVVNKLWDICDPGTSKFISSTSIFSPTEYL